MAEETRPAGSPDSEDREDVFGKLDQLMHKHRSKVPEPESPLVPELTVALPADENPSPGNIPTLVDVVGGPGSESTSPGHSMKSHSSETSAVLQAGITLRLAAELEAERARLLARVGNDPDRALALDEMITRLKRSLPAVVHSALDEDAVAAPMSKPEGDSH